MTELEAQLFNMLEQEREEVAKEQNELKSILELLSRQQQQIIELLQKPTEGDGLEAILQKVLNNFQESLVESLKQSLTQSLKESKS